jgi:hypothetical protein
VTNIRHRETFYLSTRSADFIQRVLPIQPPPACVSSNIMKSIRGAPRRSCSQCRKGKMGCATVPGNPKCNRCIATRKNCTAEGQSWVTWLATQENPNEPLLTLTHRPWDTPTSWSITNDLNETRFATTPTRETRQGTTTEQGVPSNQKLLEIARVAQNQTHAEFVDTFLSKSRRIYELLSSLKIPLAILDWIITDFHFEHRHLVIPVVCRSWLIAECPPTSAEPKHNDWSNGFPTWMSRPWLAAGIVLCNINPLTGAFYHDPAMKLDLDCIQEMYEHVLLTSVYLVCAALNDDVSKPLVPLDALVELTIARLLGGFDWSRKRGQIGFWVCHNLTMQLFYKFDLIHMSRYSSTKTYPNQYLEQLWQPHMAIMRETMLRLILNTAICESLYVSNFDIAPTNCVFDVASLSPPMPESMWLFPQGWDGYRTEIDGRIFVMENLEWMFLPRTDTKRRAGLKAVAQVLENETSLLNRTFHVSITNPAPDFSLIVSLFAGAAVYPIDPALFLGNSQIQQGQPVSLISDLMEDFAEALPEPCRTFWKDDDCESVEKFLHSKFHPVLAARCSVYFLRMLEAQIRIKTCTRIGGLQPDWLRFHHITRTLTCMCINLPEPLPLEAIMVPDALWLTLTPGTDLENVLRLCITSTGWIRLMKPGSRKCQTGWGPIMLMLRSALTFTAVSHALEQSHPLRQSSMNDAMNLLQSLARMVNLQYTTTPLAHSVEWQETAPPWITNLVAILLGSQPLTCSKVSAIVQQRFRDEL